MRIAIDGRFIGTPGGIGRYVEELVKALVKEPSEDVYSVFLREKGLKYLKDVSGFSKVRAEVPWYTIREQILMPGAVARAGTDLVHWTHWNVPLGSPRPFVITIHDLILFDYPTKRATTLGPFVYRAKNAAFRFVIAAAVKNSRNIIVPSHYVRNRIIEVFGVSEEKIVVTGEGVTGLPEVSIADQNAYLEQLGLHLPHFLAVGNAYPHKNLEGLIKAFFAVKKEEPSLSLVIAGNNDVFFQRLQKETREKGQADGVFFIPSPSDTELSCLYRSATAFVQASFIEGFGLPPIEAMKVGTPVLSSTGGSLPEVLGDAAKFFDPQSVDEMSSALLTVFRDTALRMRLRDLGIVQSAKWTWEGAAKKTREVYHRG